MHSNYFMLPFFHHLCLYLICLRTHKLRRWIITELFNYTENNNKFIKHLFHKHFVTILSQLPPPPSPLPLQAHFYALNTFEYTDAFTISNLNSFEWLLFVFIIMQAFFRTNQQIFARKMGIIFGNECYFSCLVDVMSAMIFIVLILLF